MALDPALIDKLSVLLGDTAFLTEPADCLPYGYDNSKRTVCPDAVVVPDSEEQIQSIVALCREFRTPLTTRGRGTNTTGASVPVERGIVLSTERLNRILRISASDRFAVVQPGVTSGDLQRALLPHGLFWAPDPTSAEFSSIGGNLACNAGGPRAARYGTCRDNVLALRAVDGNARLFACGTKTTKASVGYDMTRTLVGSEGTLAIITEATLKLTPRLPCQSTLRILFKSTEAAAAAIAQMMQLSQPPSIVEYMDKTALQLVRENGITDLPDAAGALLIVVVEGDETTLAGASEAVIAAAAQNGNLDLQRADSETERDRLWAARKALSPALRRLAPGKINEDVAVPVSRLPELIDTIGQISRRHELLIVCFGHAGNGNLHVNLMYDPSDDRQAKAAQSALSDVFDRVIELEGTLSGEHGIGRDKRNYIVREVGDIGIAVMRDIKRVFDPLGILNPGKVLPDQSDPMTPAGVSQNKA